MNSGIFHGGQHSHGEDIPVIAEDSGRFFRVEGGEFVLPDEVSQDKNIYTLSGNNLDVIKQIFKILGLQWDERIANLKSVDIIICIRSAFDPEVRTYTGTIQQILSAIQSSNGCKAVEGGAIVVNKDGGTSIAPEPIIASSQFISRDGGRRKHSKETYRNIDGIEYQQWTDNASSKKQAQKIIEDDSKLYPNNTFIFRKMDDFYRVYISVNEKKDGGRSPRINSSKEKSWIANAASKKLIYKDGGKIAQGYVIAPYSKIKGVLGEPNVKNETEKIGWYMAIDKNHIGAVWTESPKSLRAIIKDKFHKWYVWGANDESTSRLYEALKLQVKDIDPVKQKEKDRAISMQRWIKKRERIQELSNNVHKLKSRLSKDLKGDDEKEFLTALLLLVMFATAERIGNDDSAGNGHFGCTGFLKEHVTVVGNNVHLSYVGKSGVEHDKSFSDEKIAKAIKKAIKNAPGKFLFETSDGFRIKSDRVARYLTEYKISPKDLRGYAANKWIIDKLKKTKSPEGENEAKLQKERKKIFNAAVKKTAVEVGHGASTLKKHYMIPELPDEYILHGRIIDMKKIGYYHDGGRPGQEMPMEPESKAEESIPCTYATSSYFLNPAHIPSQVDAAMKKLFNGRPMQKSYGIAAMFPLEEVDFKDIVPTQKELRADNLEKFISASAHGDCMMPAPFMLKYGGRYYIPDGHHRTASIHINGKPILAHVGSVDDIMEDGGKYSDKEAEMLAKQLIESLSTEQVEAIIKKGMKGATDKAIIEEEKQLNDLKKKKGELDAERDAIWEKEKKLEYGTERSDSMNRRMQINREESEMKPIISHKENIVRGLKNRGSLINFTDKKNVEHKDIPYFSKITTETITFDVDTILADAMPPYMPFIDEEVFRIKGYVFDAIRIAPDEYLVATNGYKEIKNIDYEKHHEVSDAEQGYVVVSLDQLALISDYYFTKAKAVNQKAADESNARTEAYYDKLPRETREKHLNQKGIYHHLPASVKKQVTEGQWEKFTLEEKEAHYKPIKRTGAKRLTSRLEDNQMWVSYHKMYERFVNPEAVAPKPGYANEEVFSYWRKFREMMKWKIKDIKIQREAESEIRKIALETSFGESNTDTSLKEKYGILVKRQNGTKIMPAEIEQIRNGWESLNKTFGTLNNNAREVNLKISHTGLKFVFASKAAGMYIPSMKTIAVSAKFGENQFDQIFAHETAHWIDNMLGMIQGKRYATDDFESTAGRIADAFRFEMNEQSDSDYINATKECFARAMEQYFAFVNFGEDATLIFSHTALQDWRSYHADPNYVSKKVFNEKIKPLILQFLSENKSWFNYGVKLEANTDLRDGGKKDEDNNNAFGSSISFSEYLNSRFPEFNERMIREGMTLENRKTFDSAYSNWSSQ